MQRVKCTLAYDGTDFAGFQTQLNGRTVQEEVEKGLQKLHKGEKTKVIASGRTDSGVHARGQVAHFDTWLDLPSLRWKMAFTSVLPPDIQVKEVVPVSDAFHARYDAVEKEYRYVIWNDQDPDLFRRNYTWHIRKPLDVKAMQEACRYIEGEHDFTSFCRPRAKVKGSKVRHLLKAHVTKHDQEIVFIFRGTGFLYNMVRILVGTLIGVGKGERAPEDLAEILEARDRHAAGFTAPAHALFLWEVTYE
ncbi:tRNA pseudouridine(38-40) synthase TruA [Thalassobacillus sp. CUG 92003]|uniref:tRNA pseudouridine(38-40) synthase TruA n=1 Tax=Thalassobacillus sp. CUG 92003 TaxID=2736641 RepID=UPI0015E6D13B